VQYEKRLKNALKIVYFTKNSQTIVRFLETT